ncbi:hypothetical protein C8R44DRAFT_327020 [Mycena epipterygia]|nr:hypothetical protein C8R44DRAFT_327020 [Mycena epipterygia]
MSCTTLTQERAEGSPSCSYFKRQSRKTSLALVSIREETAEDCTTKSPSKKRRRLADLSIPRAPPLFTAVQGDDDWRIGHRDSCEGEVFDFPRPPGFEATSGSGSGSGSDTGSSSSPASSVPTTPTRSPIAAQCSQPLPLSFPPSQVEEDDEYYASHACAFIRPSLSSASAPTSTAHRESMVLPPHPSSQYRGSVRLSRAIIIPTRAPPPPPIVTSRVQSSLSRPAPRTLIPTDAYADIPLSPSPESSSPSPSSSSSSRLAALLSPPVPRFPAEAQGVPADIDIEGGEWEECGVEGVDQECDIIDIDVDEDERYDEIPLCSPSPSSSPCSPYSSSSLCSPSSPADNEARRFPSSPPPIGSPFAAAAYTGWYPTPPVPFALPCPPTPASAPAAPAPAAESVYDSHTPADDEADDDAHPDADARTPARELRSRWSTSTLSSVYSSHAHSHSPVSPKTFALGRYLPRIRSNSLRAANAVRTMGRVELGGTRNGYAKPMGTAKRGKRLTVADVCVVRFSEPVSVRPTATFDPVSPVPRTPGVQWASYPAPASPSPRPHSHRPSHSYTAVTPSTPSTPGPTSALYTAYTTQRSPRRRVSTASRSSSSDSSPASYLSSPASPASSSGCSSASSPASSSSSHRSSPASSSHRSSPSTSSHWSGASDAGGSECSAGNGAESGGLRRKPIPVEMFLRYS